MREKLKKLFSYYKPYRVLFYSDMFFVNFGSSYHVSDSADRALYHE